MKWSEVVEHPEFKRRSAAEQEQTRDQYFREFVAPKFTDQDLSKVRDAFDADTYIRKQDLPQGVMPSTAGAGRGDEMPGRGVPTLADRMQATMQPTLADAAPAPQRRRGGLASEFKPFGAGDERVQAPPAGLSVLDQPIRTDVPFAESSRVRRAQMDAAANDKAQSFKIGPATPAQSLEMDIQGMDANPVMRGAAAGFAGLGKTGIGAARLAADLTGSEWLADRAKGAGAIAGATERGAVANLKGGDKLVADVTSSILNSAPALAMGVMGGPAMATLFAQSTLAEYNEGRDGGFGAGESLARAGIMGAAEVLGERFGFSEQIKLLKSVGKTLPQGDLAKLFGSMLAKEIPGEQLTTAMQMLADKIGPAALRPNATIADYLEAAGETLKVTIGQTLVMGGGPAAISTARDTFGAVNRTQAAPEQLAEGAINQSAAAFDRFFRPAPEATAPTAARADSLKRFDEAAAAWGLSPKAAAAVREQAGAMIPDEVPGFLARATAALSKRGLFRRPVDEAGLTDLDKRLRPTEPEKADVAQPDLAAAAPEPAGAGDGGGDPAARGVGTVGPVPAEPQSVVPPAEAPAASGGPDQPVADGSGPDPALTIPQSARSPEDAIARMAEQDRQDYNETRQRAIAADTAPEFEDRAEDDIVSEKGKPWASKTLANRKLRDLPNGYRLARVNSGWVIKPESITESVSGGSSALAPATTEQSAPLQTSPPPREAGADAAPSRQQVAADATPQAVEDRPGSAEGVAGSLADATAALPSKQPDAAATDEKAPPTGRVPEVAAPADESDQDRSNREWRENYQTIVGTPDLNTVSVRKVEQAINYAAKVASNLGPKAWAGDEDAKKLIDSFNKEADLLKFHLKTREKPAVQQVNAGAPEPSQSGSVSPSGAAVATKQPDAPAPTPAPSARRVPKSFRKKHTVKATVFMEETGKFEQRDIDAETALAALDADIKALREFRACIGG